MSTVFLSVMLAVLLRRSQDNREQDNQFITLSASMPEDGLSASEISTPQYKRKYSRVLTSCTRKAFARCTLETSTLILGDDRERPNFQPSCSTGCCWTGGFSSEDPSHGCSGLLGMIDHRSSSAASISSSILTGFGLSGCLIVH